MNPSLACSVIIPVYNGAGTLGRCLDALSAQTAACGCEIIVVDDASADGTADIARARGVCALTLPVRQGPAAARNAGAVVAQGEVLLFLDADCEAAPDWCAQMLRPFGEPGVCAAYGAYRSRQTSRVARLAQIEFDERYARLSRRRSIDFFATHAAAIRRPVFMEMGGFRTDLRGNEDVELAFRLSRLGHRIAFAPQAVVYHEHPASLSGYLRLKVSRGYWRTQAYAAHPDKVAADDYTPPWLKLQVACGVAALVLLALSALRVTFRPWFLLAASITLLTTLPFALFVRRAAPDLVWVAPLFSLARSAALGLGVIAGLVAMVGGRHRRAGTGGDGAIASRQSRSQ